MNFYRSNECDTQNPHSLSSPCRRIGCGDFCVLGCADANIVFPVCISSSKFVAFSGFVLFILPLMGKICHTMPRYTTKQKAHTTFQNNHILPQHDMKQHSRLHQVGGCFLFIMWKCRNYLYVFNNNIPIILGFV